MGTTQTKSLTIRMIQESSTKSAVNSLHASKIYHYQNVYQTKIFQKFKKYSSSKFQNLM